MDTKEPIIIDSDEEIAYIKEKTGLDEDTILKVLFASDDFLREKGIIKEIEGWQIAKTMI